MASEIDDNGLTCAFTLKNTDISIANGIRRSCFADVPTLAIEELAIETNTSVHADEVLALRLGLMVLRGTGQPASIVLDVACPDDACERAVTMADFAWPADGLEPMYPETPIVTLERGQRIKLLASVEWGTGHAHAKWNPCNRVSLKHLPDSTYRLEIESNGQHPAIGIALMSIEHLINLMDTVAERNYDEES